MKDPISQLNEIIITLCDLPGFLANVADASFTLGCVVTKLEYLKTQLKSMGNGDI
jgi:hypothetical protein